MRIRHILPQLELGALPPQPLNAALSGLVNVALQLAVEQARMGHDVEIVCPTEDRGERQELAAGVRIYWLPTQKRWRIAGYDFSYRLPLSLFCRRGRAVDVTHVHSGPYFIARPKSRAAVLHYNDPPQVTSPMYGRSIAHADRIICASDHVRQVLISAQAYPPERIHTIHNGMSYHRFAYADRAVARAYYGISPQCVVVLYAGRIVPEKGLIHLIDAFRHVSQAGRRDTLLIVAGTSRLGISNLISAEAQAAYAGLDEYEALVKQRAVGLPIRFVGNVASADLPRFYSSGDIFVCPSARQDTFPLVVLEALASGLPVIGSAVGGIPEQIEHGRTGLLAPAGDVTALHEALVTLIADEDARCRMGRAARDWARQLDWPQVARRVEDIYAAALS